MIIDVHGHIGRLAERDFSLPEMKRYLNTCGVQHVLVSNLDAASHHPAAGNVEEAPANLASLHMRREDARFVPLYWVRLGQFDSNLRAFAGALDVEPFAGAAFAPLLNGFAADDPRLDAYLSVLAKIKKAAVFHSARDDAGRPERVHTLARRHPRVPVVLCDAGGDTHWNEALDVVGRAWERQDARLYLCSGRASAEDVLAAVNVIGDEAVVFGSDATCFGANHTDRCQTFLEQLQESLQQKAFAKVTGENATTLFRLSAPE